MGKGKNTPFKDFENEVFPAIEQQFQRAVDDKLALLGWRGVPMEAAEMIRYQEEYNFLEDFLNGYASFAKELEHSLDQIKQVDQGLFDKISKASNTLLDEVLSTQNIPMDLDKRFPEALKSEIYSKGMDLFKQNDFVNACGCFTYLALLDQKNSSLWFMRGLALQNQEDYRMAWDAYGMALEVDPSNLLTYPYLIESMVLSNDLQAAKTIYKGVLEEVPSDEWRNDPFLTTRWKEVEQQFPQLRS